MAEENKETMFDETEQDKAFEEEAAEAETEETVEADSPEEAPEETEAADAKGSGKKGIFGRGKKKDDKEKEALKEKNAVLEEKVIRQMAEFDNYRKRTDKEKEQMFSMGEKSVIEKFLPIVDNFERGFGTVQKEDESDAFVEGMKKVYQQLMKQLEELGVTPIEAVGKEFDPNFHNAVMQVESDEYESGIVAAEFIKGYMFHDTVIRHSMVSVVQ